CPRALLLHDYNAVFSFCQNLTQILSDLLCKLLTCCPGCSIMQGERLPGRRALPTNLPSFNLKAVVQQTGVKPDTLRAWERRYGLPQPARSDGHQRLYTARDVLVIRWLIARQAEGLSIRQAVALWRQAEAAGQDPLHVPAAVARQRPGVAAIGAEGP